MNEWILDTLEMDGSTISELFRKITPAGGAIFLKGTTLLLLRGALRGVNKFQKVENYFFFENDFYDEVITS